MRRIALTAGVAACLFFWAGQAAACPILKSAEPRVGSVVGVAPDHVSLRFSDAMILDRSRLDVLDANGVNWTAGPLRFGADDHIVTVPLRLLPPGRYKVVWHIRCDCTGTDGETIPGDYSFTVRP